MNHSRPNDTTTIMEKTYLPGETEPCLVRTDKTESIRIINLDGSERKPSVEYHHRRSSAGTPPPSQPHKKMTFLEKVSIT